MCKAGLSWRCLTLVCACLPLLAGGSLVVPPGHVLCSAASPAHLLCKGQSWGMCSIYFQCWLGICTPHWDCAGMRWTGCHADFWTLSNVGQWRAVQLTSRTRQGRWSRLRGRYKAESVTAPDEQVGVRSKWTVLWWDLYWELFFFSFFLNSSEVLIWGRSSWVYGGSEGADRGWKTAGLGVVSQI